MANKRKYENEVQKLILAIDIAIESFQKHWPKDFQQEHIDVVINSYNIFKEECIETEEKFKNLKSLKYTEEEAFIYFNEGVGETVNYFWKRLKEEGLEYKRKNNRLKKILKKGKIKNDLDYQYITDIIVVAQQDGMINNDEVIILNNMLGDFEKKK